MKIVRFVLENKEHYGILKDGIINVISGDIYGSFNLLEENYKLEEVSLLSPSIPTKAVCIGLNYMDHVKEMKHDIPKEPVMFIKPSSTLNHPNSPIKYPAITNNLHYEGELAIVIKKEAYMVSKENAYDYILGYTCANDVTARDIQYRDGQWTRGKSFNTFMPLGPCIETDLNPNKVDIKLFLNGDLKQSSNTENFIFDVPTLLEFITEVMTLYPGDVILTGTPSGVGPMLPGDKVEVKIEGIGSLENEIK